MLTTLFKLCYEYVNDVQVFCFCIENTFNKINFDIGSVFDELKIVCCVIFDVQWNGVMENMNIHRITKINSKAIFG